MVKKITPKAIRRSEIIKRPCVHCGFQTLRSRRTADDQVVCTDCWRRHHRT